MGKMWRTGELAKVLGDDKCDSAAMCYLRSESLNVLSYYCVVAFLGSSRVLRRSQGTGR